ncbi:hypothetical protein KFK09_023810 [Dendrobium nobile]|uniref:Uncharacterized protein n=1 Tax=Dendrobium nobile TaxID=94219 RepID=A0A8T3AB94_DENNO|nr:hypothetical protein KFK09_023810 [Dendrobium nobile]
MTLRFSPVKTKPPKLCFTRKSSFTACANTSEQMEDEEDCSPNLPNQPLKSQTAPGMPVQSDVTSESDNRFADEDSISVMRSPIYQDLHSVYSNHDAEPPSGGLGSSAQVRDPIPIILCGNAISSGKASIDMAYFSRGRMIVNDSS